MKAIRYRYLFKFIFKFLYFELFITIIGVIIDFVRIKLFNHDISIQTGFERRFFTNIAIGLGWSMANLFSDDSKIIELNNDLEEQLLRIKQILKTMKYNIVKEENDLIKFKASLLLDPFEEINLKISEKQIVLEGSERVLKKILKKISSSTKS